MSEAVPTAAIERCIRDYIAAWNARDFLGMAAHFTEPAVFVLPTGTWCLASREALVGFLRGVFEGLERGGFSHSTIGAITPTRCAEGLWIAEVADIDRHHRDGHVIETIEVQYTLRREADGVIRLVAALWCEAGWRR